MTYYHLRYNIYPPPGFPVEKEEWVSVSRKHNEQQIKRLLNFRYRTKVTLILSAVICKEEYESKISQPASDSRETPDFRPENVRDWALDRGARMIKKLNDDAYLNDERYRNVTKPPPLL
jgi:hypothetical protein